MPVKAELRALTAEIIAAYLLKNPIDSRLDLKALQASVYDALAECAKNHLALVKSRRAPRGKSNFRQRDIRAAINATEKAGKEVSGVEIGNDGRIKIVIGKPAASHAPGANEWDAVFK